MMSPACTGSAAIPRSAAFCTSAASTPRSTVPRWLCTSWLSSARVYRAFDPTFTNDWRLTAAVKVPGLLAGAALTALFYFTVLRFTRRVDLAQWTALAYWLNPATVLNGEVLGYLDPLMMLPAVGALVALYAGRPGAAGLLWAAAFLTKPQGILVAPAVLLAAWHTGQWRAVARVSAACAAGLVIGVLPFVWVGALPNMIQAFGSWAGRRDILSGYAANLWWVVTWLARAWKMIPEFGVPAAYLEPVKRILAISSYMDLGLPNPRPFGIVFVTVACVWACWRARHMAATSASTRRWRRSSYRRSSCSA